MESKLTNTIFTVALIILAIGFMLVSVFVWNHVRNQSNRLHDIEMNYRALNQRVLILEIEE